MCRLSIAEEERPSLRALNPKQPFLLSELRPALTLQAEATFSLCQLACEK